MVKSRFKESEKPCRRGEEDDECSTTIGGYVVKTLEALIWQSEKEKDEEELLYYLQQDKQGAIEKTAKLCHKVVSKLLARQLPLS
jgi:RNA binding exosome subunit